MATDLDGAYAHCATVLRETDRERYWADLFAPATHRRHLFALHAFAAEVDAVRDAVSAPMPGEIRLQWWRDAIGAEARGDVASHPVAAALLDTVSRFDLPKAAFLDLIDARVFDLYDDAMPTLGDLEGYLGETSSALMRLGSLILADGKDPGFADAAGHAGLAHGLTRLLRALRRDARAARLLPEDLLDRHKLSRDSISQRQSGGELSELGRTLIAEARRHHREAAGRLASAPALLRPAFLPLALVPTDLIALEKLHNLLAPAADRSSLSTLWALWRASRKGF